MRGVVDRVGGILISPRATLAALHRGRSGGVKDLLLLLALEVLALHLPRLASAVWFMFTVSYRGGITSVLNTIAEGMLMPMGAMFVGIVLVSLATRGAADRGRNADLVALCVVPAVCLELSLALVATAAGWQPWRWLGQALMAAGGVWTLALWVATVKIVRAGQGDGEGEVALPPPRARTAAGGVVLTIAIVMLVSSAIWVGRNTENLRPVSQSMQAPDLSLRDVAGKVVTLSSQRPNVVLVTFWASWCGPCLRELPVLERLEQELAPRGFKVLAVNVEGSREKVTAVVNHTGSKLTMLLDDGAAAVRYGVQTLPHQVLVGHDGVVAHIHVGAGRLGRLRKEVARALSRAAPGARQRPAAGGATHPGR